MLRTDKTYMYEIVDSSMWYGDWSHLCDMDRNCYNLHRNRILLIQVCDTYMCYMLIHVILGTDKAYMYKIVDSCMWYGDWSHLSDMDRNCHNLHKDRILLIHVWDTYVSYVDTCNIGNR